jgi:hypothetical protein
MKKIGLLILCVAIGLTVLSQDIKQDTLKKRKIEYYFQVQSGALIGCNSCSDGKQISFTGSTTHGIKIGRKLRVGGGVGLDSYFEWNTMPVFGSVSWDVFGKKNALFVELNYGGSLASWRPQNFQEYGYQKSDAGKVYSYVLGYRIRYEKMRISVGVGHKTQLVTSYYEYPTYYWNNNNYVPGDASRRIVKNEMNRLMVYLAVGWK